MDQSRGRRTMIFRRAVLMLLCFEAAIGGWWLAFGHRRAKPMLPAESLLDPVMARTLKDLANRAECGTVDDWRDLAQGLLSYGYYGYAEGCYRKAFALDPTDRAAAFGIAFCLDRTGRIPESTAAYLRIAERADSETRTQCLYAVGRNYLRVDDPMNAERTLSEISAFAPAAYHLALLLVRTGRSAEALPLINRQLSRYPRSVKFLVLKRRAEQDLRKSDAAAATSDQIEVAEYVVDTAYSRAFIEQFAYDYGLTREMNLYNAAIERGERGEAARALDRLLDSVRGRVAPESHLIWDAAIRDAIGMANLELAQSRLDEAKRLGVYLESAGMLQGDIYWNAHAVADAVRAWDRAAVVSPSIEIYERLSRATAQLDDPKQRRYAAELLRLRGRAAYLDNRLPEARAAFEQSLQQAESPSVWYALGEIHRQQGDLPAAISAYDSCLVIAPDHGGALDRLQELWPTQTP